MIARSLWHFTFLMVAAAGCWWLVGQYGPWLAGAIWAMLALVACVLGFVLARTFEVGQVTWKNRIVGWLVPWGWRINGGKLWPIPVVSWIVWMLVGVAAALLAPRAMETLTSGDLTIRILLGTAWAVDGLALGSVVGTLRQHFSNSTGGGSLRMIAAVITGLIGLSVALHLYGLTAAGLLVAGGPPLVVSFGYGLFLATLLLIGRNRRWN